MWRDRAHLVFLLLLAVIFHRVIGASLRYGQTLRRLRQTCAATCDDLKANRDPDNDEFVVLVRDRESKDIVHRNNCDANEKEIMRIMNDPQTKDQVVSFKHIPDAENMSHIVGVFKEGDDKYDCIAVMQT